MLSLRNRVLVFSRLGSQNVHHCNLITVLLEQVELTGFFVYCSSECQINDWRRKTGKIDYKSEYSALRVPSLLGNDDMQSFSTMMLSFFSYKGTEWPSSDKLQDLHENLLEENAVEHCFSSSRFPHITWNYYETEWWIYWYDNCKVGNIAPTLFHCCSESYAFEWDMSGCSHCAVQVFWKLLLHITRWGIGIPLE